MCYAGPAGVMVCSAPLFRVAVFSSLPAVWPCSASLSATPALLVACSAPLFVWGGGGRFRVLLLWCVVSFVPPPPLPLPLSACVCYRARRVPPGAWRVASPPYAPADLRCASVWGRSIAKVCPPPKKEVYPEVMNSAFQGFVTRILFPVCDPHPNAPPTPCPLFHGTRSPTFPQAPSRPAAQRAGLWELVVRWFASMYCPEPSGCAQVNHRSCPNMPRDSAPPPPRPEGLAQDEARV